MEGVPCVASVDDLPEQVDLAVIAVPPSAVPEVAAQCGRNGVRALMVMASGLGAAGADLLDICRRYGMRLVGPNCFGIIVPWIGLDVSLAANHPLPGVAGVVVQSGGVGIALLERMSRLGIGISSFASVGDKYDVSPTDMLNWWAQDEVTQIAVLYVESFGSPRKFAGTARRVGQRMPVLTVIGGRSPAGQRAAASHHAQAATPLVTQEALFAQAGIITTTSLGELIDTAALLACQPLPAGNRVAIVSNTGGAGVLAADACGDHGLQVVRLSAATQRELRRLLPRRAVVIGPVDTTPMVTTDTFRACLEKVAADDGVDAVLAVAVPTAISDLSAAVAAAVVGKPLAVALLDRVESVQRLKRLPVPGALAAHVQTPAQPMVPRPPTRQWTLSIRRRSSMRQRRPSPECRLTPTRKALPVHSVTRPATGPGADGSAARSPSWADCARPMRALWSPDSWPARQPAAGCPRRRPPSCCPATACRWLPPCRRPASRKQSQPRRSSAAPSCSRPGPRGWCTRLIPGGYGLTCAPRRKCPRAYRALAADFGPSLKRVFLQSMLTGGVEMMIGVVQEPVFGPLVVFGSGGMATETQGDHVTQLTPLTDADADEMLRTVRAAPAAVRPPGPPAGGHRRAR